MELETSPECKFTHSTYYHTQKVGNPAKQNQLCNSCLSDLSQMFKDGKIAQSPIPHGCASTCFYSNPPPTILKSSPDTSLCLLFVECLRLKQKLFLLKVYTPVKLFTCFWSFQVLLNYHAKFYSVVFRISVCYPPLLLFQLRGEQPPLVNFKHFFPVISLSCI